MARTEKVVAPVVAKKIEDLLEERKTKRDRRVLPDDPLPASVERRSGKDRRDEPQNQTH